MTICQVYTEMKEKEQNRWYDELIWCPSQCYYYFMHGDEMFCVYLRWRHQDPWTVEVIKCENGDMSLDTNTSTWKAVCVPYFDDTELTKLKEYVLARLNIIMALWPHCEHHISLRIDDYKMLPPDVRDTVVEMTGDLLESCMTPARKIRTTHVGDVKALETLIQMDVRNHLSAHNGEPVAGEGLYINPDTVGITISKDSVMTDRTNFYPFSSLVRYNRKDGTFDVDKNATANVASTYYAFGTSRSAVCDKEGHDFRYNSSRNSLPPTKCICAWCHRKWVADYSDDIIHGDVWHEVEKFENQTRSDEELVDSWFR